MRYVVTPENGPAITCRTAAGAAAFVRAYIDAGLGVTVAVVPAKK